MPHRYYQCHQTNTIDPNNEKQRNGTSCTETFKKLKLVLFQNRTISVAEKYKMENIFHNVCTVARFICYS